MYTWSTYYAIAQPGSCAAAGKPRGAKLPLFLTHPFPTPPAMVTPRSSVHDEREVGGVRRTAGGTCHGHSVSARGRSVRRWRRTAAAAHSFHHEEHHEKSKRAARKRTLAPSPLGGKQNREKQQSQEEERRSERPQARQAAQQ